MATIGQSIAGPRFYESDEVGLTYQLRCNPYSYPPQWFDRQKAYLDSLETQLRGLVKAIDVVSKQRTGTLRVGHTA